MFNVRGRHPTVYPVQLPTWSCPDIVKELIVRFSKYLRTELDFMWKSHNKIPEQFGVPNSGHAHNPSLQSVSSAITDSSQFSEESNPDNLQDDCIPKRVVSWSSQSHQSEI
jgi:hypothetical protein